MRKDAEILLSVASEALTAPVLHCAQAKIKSHNPRPDELGDIVKAARLADTSLGACGYVEAKKRLKQSIAAKYAEIPGPDINRITNVAFDIPFALALNEAAMKLNAVPPGPARAITPIVIPCTPDLAAKRGHACYKESED